MPPPDSGVGSLESPKHAGKEQQQEATQPPPVPTPVTKPGPQPLKAMGQFGAEGEDTSAPGPGVEAMGSQFRFV